MNSAFRFIVIYPLGSMSHLLYIHGRIRHRRNASLLYNLHDRKMADGDNLVHGSHRTVRGSRRTVDGTQLLNTSSRTDRTDNGHNHVHSHAHNDDHKDYWPLMRCLRPVK